MRRRIPRTNPTVMPATTSRAIGSSGRRSIVSPRYVLRQSRLKLPKRNTATTGTRDALARVTNFTRRTRFYARSGLRDQSTRTTAAPLCSAQVLRFAGELRSEIYSSEVNDTDRRIRSKGVLRPDLSIKHYPV